MNNKEQAVQMDAQLFYVSNVNIIHAEEDFAFVVMSGNSARRYVFTPKHAKRLSLLLQKQVSEYEEKHGELDTNLVEKTDSGDKPSIGFGNK